MVLGVDLLRMMKDAAARRTAFSRSVAFSYRALLCQAAAPAGSIIGLEQSSSLNCDACFAFSTSSTTSNEKTSPITDKDANRRSGRRRHQFTNDGSTSNKLENVPSFRDFQLKLQIWALYRQFTRVIYRSGGSNKSESDKTRKSELQEKVRVEFRMPQQKDNWQLQRSLSEGTRRLKELSAMLGNSTTAQSKSSSEGDATSTTTTTSASSSIVPPPPASTKPAWPWNNPTSNNKTDETRGRSQHYPLVFPPKSVQ